MVYLLSAMPNIRTNGRGAVWPPTAASRTNRVRFQVQTQGELTVDTPVDLALTYVAGDDGLAAGGNLWLFYDIRQFTASAVSRQDYSRPESIIVRGPAGTAWAAEALCDGAVLRTLDLYPAVTEFLHGLHVRCTAGAVAPGESVSLRLKTDPRGFLLPRNATGDFFFSLVEDPRGAVKFRPVPGERYWNFSPRDAALGVLRSNGLAIESGPAARLQVVCPSESTGRTTVRALLTDAYGNPVHDTRWAFEAASSAERTTRQEAHGPVASTDLAVAGDFDTVVVTATTASSTATTGQLTGRGNPIRVQPSDGSGTGALQLYWGDLHGMLFNQRPLEEYFLWARDVACLDWAGGQLFSYCTSVAETWQAFKAVWRAFNQPGRFVSLPSAECGAPPDGSHRHWFLPEVDHLPPIFCEARAAAADPRLRAKFDPGTIYCADYRELYRAVRERGGFVHGHFHTHFYEGELLAEIYQKQVKDTAVEEAKINHALRQGARLGIVAGSDTHDSRPANPFPEPGGPSQPAGLTGVWAERLDRAGLFAAFGQRRCYATTGQRLLLDCRVNGTWMGSTAVPDRRGRFALQAEVLGTADIDLVELLVNGDVVKTYAPRRQHVRLIDDVPLTALPERPEQVLLYCYLRIHQRDGHRAWSSPIWLGARR